MNFTYSPTYIYLLWIFFVLSEVQGGVLHGTITDEQGESIPGASIIAKSLQIGTSTNLEGEYEIKLPAGQHHISFQSLGFTSQSILVTLSEDEVKRVDIILKPVYFKIDEVKIYSGGEDPAYPIMRNAISMAPYYSRQAKSYNANLYLRGTVQIEKIPRLIRKQLEKNIENTKIEVGKAYSIESLNEIEFIAPDSFKHKIISTHTNFDFPEQNSPIPYINSSFYASDNELFISPLSPLAMRHYKFQYEGYIREGNATINKIKVIPRRKSQQLFKGDLYLVDGLWNIHSLDLTLSTFYGDVNIRQVYAPIKGNIWLPVSHIFKIDASMIGLAANARYVASVKYSNIVEDKKLPTPQLIVSAVAQGSSEDEEMITEERVPTKTEQQIAELSQKDRLSNRDMTKLVALSQKAIKEREKDSEKVLEISGSYKMEVSKDTLSGDSDFWKSVRPIPLTTDEKKSFSISDSIAHLTKTDSLSTTIRRQALTSKLLFGGHLFEKEKSVLRYWGLVDFNAITFNAVDGWKYYQRLRLQLNPDSLYRLTLNVRGGYAFNRNAFEGSISMQQNYAPKRRGVFSFSAGSGSNDFKRNLRMMDWQEMISSLLFKENYTRWYNDDYVSAYNRIDITNGLVLGVEASYHDYSTLNNHTNFSFFKRKSDYHPNDAVAHWSDNNNYFKNQTAFITEATIEYTPEYYYRIRDGRKRMLYSDYPTFRGHAEYASGWFDTDNDYLLLEAEVYKKARTSFMPTFSWKVGAGKFLRNRQIHFSRFKHFKGSDAPLFFGNPTDQFVLNGYYSTSTPDWYITGQATYSSPWLLLKNLPVISETIWNENLHLSYLHTPQNPHYVQLGYSINRIYIFFDVGVFVGFSDGKYAHWGPRISVDW
ncbi:MAG TPA: DUF5686 and carboxypeptidase regulatory-like domain-containing protein [Marinilabiliaceae bacterium]|nr:DUF5686 and carboxypeptidase regulatory-like domain-containing protein [Marinilabiliaceae bacterium]